MSDQDWSQLDKYAEKWLQYGFCTDPVNFEEAVKATNLAYTQADLPLPLYHFESRGPIMNGMLAALIYNYALGLDIVDFERPLTLGAKVKYKDQLYLITKYDRTKPEKVSIRPFSEDESKAQGRAKAVHADKLEIVEDMPPYIETWRASYQELTRQIEQRYKDSWDPSKIEIPEPNDPQEWAQDPWKILLKDAANLIKEQCYGSHDAVWGAYFEYWLKERGEKYVERITGVCEVIKHSGWWMGFSQVCIVSDRWSDIHYNDRLQLHNTSGPAMGYRDGLSYWYIDGNRVDEQIVMRPETQTIDQLLGEKNAEIRRIRIDRYGWDKFIEQSDAKHLDSRKNDLEGTMELLVTAHGHTVLITGCPSKGEVYYMEVPEDITTCQDAQDFLHSGSILDEELGPPNNIGRT